MPPFLTIKAASLLGTAALTATALLHTSTAQADDGPTFNCQLLHIHADTSLEGYTCGEPTTYDGPGKVHYLYSTNGYACTTITARPSTENNTTTNLKATGCTPDDHTNPPTSSHP
ncbi:hypothetical protein QFZ75_007790 [Streptomyces sp. V3I8]|uniref:hypothetical protein n=1 Tax=Streptomyces sp. V3I8 TaxID=3042279 RepID=UPI0027816D65|nr:hypothetical protein [Streptomyces sp. V3I8]MDQ1041374.1 hypothetical protein [Streptomyces sp. V3I8]